MRVGLSSQTERRIVAYVTFMKDKRYDLVDLYERADTRSDHVHVTGQHLAPGPRWVGITIDGQAENEATILSS